MNEKLKVSHFGPIENAEIELKKVTIFIGPQGSGKSTLAKLVAVCKEEERPYLSEKESTIGFRVMDYGINDYKNEKTHFSYESQFSEISYKGVYVKNGTPKSLNIEIELMAIKENLKPYGPSPSIAQLEKPLSDFRKIIQENGILTPIYIPTERFFISTISSSLYGLLTNNISLPKIITEFGNKYEVARKSVKSILSKTQYIDLFNLEFIHENGNDFLIDKEKNYTVNLNVSASGMQAAVPMVLVVNNSDTSNNQHFIIEEPELNLFPTTQKKLVGFLADRCTQGNNELLITTHSPYILSAVNNLIFAYKVAQEVPEKAEEIAKIIPKEQWLNPNDVAAYYVGEGTAKSIISENGLIGENELDGISEDIAGERDVLFQILRSKTSEAIN